MAAENMPRGSRGTYVCANPSCKKEFTARTADRARGWARFCSKSCKAVKQEAATGQHRAYLDRKEHQDEFDGIGHPFSDGYFGHGQY